VPTSGNPYGPLYALTNLAVDSVSSPFYRVATGTGCNRDSTLAFRVRHFAPKDAANADYYLSRYDVYAGPKNQGFPIQGICVAFAADWDVPADNDLDNGSGGDAPAQMVYQKGTGNSANNQRYAMLGVIRVDGQTAPGGFVWNNSTTVDPLRVFHADSLWVAINAVSKFEGAPTVGDLNSVIVAGKQEVLAGASDTLRYVFVLAGQTSGSASSLTGIMNKARWFNCQHVSPDQVGCPEYICGDADGSSLVTISDVVFLISYIFAGGAPPSPLQAGDADCTQIVTISDAVYLISFIFAGGPAPCSACA
jgi:hypothetical protein